MGLKENKKRIEAKIASGEPVYKYFTDARQGVGLNPVKVIKCGNKVAEIGIRESFDMETLLHRNGEYNARFKIYIDKEDYENEILRAKLLETIKSLVGSCSLDKIKMIHSVVVQASAENKQK